MEELYDNIDKKISKLNKLKYEYLHKIKEVESEIKNLYHEKYNYCKKVNNGHVFISEKEQGPYGETFHYCKICGYEY